MESNSENPNALTSVAGVATTSRVASITELSPFFSICDKLVPSPKFINVEEPGVDSGAHL